MSNMENGRWTPPSSLPNIRGAKELSLDIETYDPLLSEKGPSHIFGEGYIAGVAIAVTPFDKWYIPTLNPYHDGFEWEEIKEWLNSQVDRDALIVGANLMYDLSWLLTYGVPFINTNKTWDVQFAEALLDEHRDSYALDAIAKNYGFEGKDCKEMYEWGAKNFGGRPTAAAQGKNIYRMPLYLVGPYAERDAELPLLIKEKQAPLLEEQELMGVMDLEHRLMPVLVAMQMRGVRVDMEQREKVRGALDENLKENTTKLEELVGRKVNVNSTKEIQSVFDENGWEYPMTEKGNPSFKKEFLAAHDSEFAKIVLEIRKIAKLKRTFVDGYFELAYNDRLHPSYHPLRSEWGGTVSGRISCSQPNAQNIPSRDPIYGPLIRSLFVPEEGEVWCKLDYSQIEYRFLTHYAVGKGAEEARRKYSVDPNTDFHRMIEQETGMDRKSAKCLNFGLCLAEGTMILTDHGLIPIEKVCKSHRLWDGVEWVSHAGVVCNGVKEVMYYDGLWLTEDHEVFTRRKGKVHARVAASSNHPIIRSGEGVVPIFVGDVEDRKRKHSSGREVSVRLRHMLRMRKTPSTICGQYSSKKSKKLQMPVWKVQRPSRAYSWSTLRRHEATVRKKYSCFFSQLQGPRDKGLVQKSRGIYPLGAGDLARRTIRREGVRSYRQRWALLQGQPASCDTKRELTQHAKIIKKQAVVYDILDAGPRHRFTANGRLVSNCYGQGVAKTAESLGVSTEEAIEYRDLYFSRSPYVKATFDLAANRAQQRGFIRTILGRRARFPFWEPADYELANKLGIVFTSRAECAIVVAKELGLDFPVASLVKRARAYKALNSLLQGSAADMIKKAMVDIWESGVCDVLGPPLITVHDELDFSKPRTPEGDEAIREVKHLMENAIKLKVPVITDLEIGPNWGHVEEVE